MARVFISFAAEDARLAAELTTELAARDHDVFRHDQNLAVGQRWEEQLGRELRDADAIVILLTKASAHSEWIIHEAGMALGYSREKGHPLVLPVLCDPVEIPGPLAAIQALPAYDRDLRRVAEQLDRLLLHQVGRKQAREEERQEVARRVEETAADYIRKSREDLNRRETRYRSIAYLWYLLAFLSIVAGVVFAFWRAQRAEEMSTWVQLAELLALGVLVVAMLGLAKLSFSLEKAFMVEALRNADRSHAISFGEFYLKAYGERAAWAEVKEAFQHWNVDKGSSFSSQTPKDFDPQILELAVELIKSIRPELKK